MIKIISLFGLLVLFASCMQESPIKNDFVSFVPKDINDGWEISTPESENIDSSNLISIFQDLHRDESTWMIRSMSVFRNNKLIAESYTRDDGDRITPRGFWSCTKQVLGILTGIATEIGLINSIDDKIDLYLPDLVQKYKDKKDITIRNLLMMKSGIDFYNYGIGSDDMEVLQENPDSFLEYSLQRPLINKPGEIFQYKDSDPMIVSGIIQRQAKKPTDEWADEVLFSKIGFKNYQWRRYKDGLTIGSYGLISTPREMAKFVQLVLNGGIWKGERIISKQWLDTMVAPLVETSDEKRFGYLWWSYPEYNTFFMSGNGRQIIFGFPDKQLIVAITSEPKLQGRFQLSTPKAREIAMRIYNICK